MGLCVHARHLPRTLPKDYKRVPRTLDKTVSGQNVNEPSPPLGNVLSWGQAAKLLCPEKGAFVWALENLAGLAAGTSQLAAPPGPDRTVTRAFYYTSVKQFSAPLRPLSIPHRSAEGLKPTHIQVCITALVKTFRCL